MSVDTATSARTATLLTGMQVFDGEDGTLLTDHAIAIDENGTIRSIGPASELEAASNDDVRRIDLSGSVLTPGLINMHVHLGLALDAETQALVASGADSDLLLVMADSARRALLAGITTVRLVGENRYLDFALRRGVNAGAVDGPRIFTAGHALCCTGGHGWNADALEGDGADDFRRLTRLQIREGADLIKVCISGGIAGEHEQIDTPQLFDDEMEAVIQTAHDWGRKVTAHVGPSSTLNRAIRLGLDCVEHGYELSVETTELMREHDVWYVPTISVSRCADYFDEQGVPQWMKDRALAAGPRHWESLENAIRSGVKIAMGTDMPPSASFEGTTATVREMEFMAEAGMTPLEVMRSATSSAAELLGNDDIGRVRVGARADFIAMPGNPVSDVSELRAINWVMKDGLVYRDDRTSA